MIHKWTVEEMNLMKRYYPLEGTKILKRMPYRTSDQVRSKACLMGLKVGNHNNIWTPEEREILRRWYPVDRRKAKELLAGHSWASIQKEARRLNLCENLPWTYKEDDLIKRLYPREGSKIGKLLPFRTKQAIQKRANLLNVKFIRC